MTRFRVGSPPFVTPRPAKPPGYGIMKRPAWRIRAELHIWVKEDYPRFEPIRPDERRKGMMRKTDECVSWVVYRRAIHGKADKMKAVCEQGEWETMERVQPGDHILVKAGITNEGEAERLARAADGDPSKPAKMKFPSR